MNLLASKLNSTYKNIQSQLVKPSLKVDFWAGETALVLPIIAKKVVPFSKVAILYSKESFEVFGKSLTENLKKNGNSVISVVMPEGFSDNLQDYSDIFNLAEDVRLIVTLDQRYYSICKYFASLRQIDCAMGVRKLNSFSILSPEISIKNQDILENVKVSSRCHLFLDYKEIKKDKESLSNAYAFIVSNALALVDYRINALLMRKTINKQVYELASKSVVQTYSLFANKKENFFSILTENLFNLEIANLFAENNLYKNFSSSFISYVSKDSDYAGNLLLASTMIAKIYDLFCSDKYDKLLKAPNYLERAEYISYLLQVSHAEVTKLLNENYKVVDANRSNGSQYFKKIKKDIQSFINCSSVMLNTFTVLGGSALKKDQSLSKAIKHSGDLVVNGMTVVRESGITELI